MIDVNTFEKYVSMFIQAGLDRMNIYVLVLLLTLLALPAYYLFAALTRVAWIQAQ